MRNDIDLKNDVKAELIWDPRVDATNVDVTANNGLITLTGTVPGYSEKIAAEIAALSVLGVKTVINDLDVMLTSAFERSDSDIKDAAERSLIWNMTVPDEDITVNVNKGWVTLEGTVRYYYQKDAARNTVVTLPGVMGVSDKINVKTTVAPENPKERIKDALKRDAIVDADKVDISVEDNKVILTGNLRSWTERRRAERVALAAPGIYEIENNILVG